MSERDEAAVGDETPLYPPTVKPPAKALSPLPFLFTFVRNPLRTLPAAVYEQPILAATSPFGSAAWIMDPELIDRVLLKDAEAFPKAPIEARVFGPALGGGILTAEGAAWRWQRKAAAPAFRHSELLSAASEMVAVAEAVVSGWRARGPAFVAAIDEEMMDATFDVIGRTVLGGCSEDVAARLKAQVHAFLEPITWEIGYAILGLPEWLWHPAKGRLKRAAEESRGIVRDLVAQRKAEAGARGDLLGKLIGARHPDSGAEMPEDLLVDNLATFLVAGHETTARALTWTLYLLARAPEWQQRVLDEVVAVAGERSLTAADIEHLSVTQMVLKEAMRLYPPVPVISRMTTDWAELGGHRLPPRSLIVVPVYATHRHSLLWEDPHRFDPNRFAAGHDGQISRAQYLPFGYGPRICIGAAFAMMEATLLLATFVRAMRFVWDGRHCPEPVSRVTLRPQGGMPLKVEVR